MVTIAIDSETEKALETLGATTVIRKSQLALELLQRAVAEDLEDREWARIAEDRLANPGKRYSMEDVVRDLGLDD